MTIILIIIAFFSGGVYGYSARADHCDRHHHECDDTDQPRFRGPY